MGGGVEAYSRDGTSEESQCGAYDFHMAGVLICSALNADQGNGKTAGHREVRREELVSEDGTGVLRGQNL